MNQVRQHTAAETETSRSPHSLVAGERREITVTGVREVDSFDEHTVVLVTTCGRLVLEGDDLRVLSLDSESGTVAVTGKLTGLLYDDDPPPQPGKRRRPRLFG